MQQRAARDTIITHLMEAVDRVRAESMRVELWAMALITFSQPIPDYDDHLLPRMSSNDGTSAQHSARPRS